MVINNESILPKVGIACVKMWPRTLKVILCTKGYSPHSFAPPDNSRPSSGKCQCLLMEFHRALRQVLQVTQASTNIQIS